MEKLYRSKTDRVVFGVCGGIAEYLGVDSTLVRILTVLLLVLHVNFAIIYLILAFVIPENPKKTKRKKKKIKTKNMHWVGFGLIIIGVLLLMDSYNIINWNQLWPILIIIIGGYLIWEDEKKRKK